MTTEIKEENKIYCHDCETPIRIEEKEIKNGFLLAYRDGGEELKVFKCSNCYKKNPSLKDFRKCEVYSRVVGYLRPVQQWNVGKKQEYKEREVFVQPEEAN